MLDEKFEIYPFLKDIYKKIHFYEQIGKREDINC